MLLILEFLSNSFYDIDMKLPDKIQGRNRVRDAAIVLYFKRNALTYIELAEKFKLTERRILQILSKNHAFIKRDKEWEKEKRIARLERWLNDDKNKDSRKDPVEIQAELRKEIDGDEKSSSTGETKIIIIRPYDTPKAVVEQNGTENRVETVSRQISI